MALELDKTCKLMQVNAARDPQGFRGKPLASLGIHLHPPGSVQGRTQAGAWQALTSMKKRMRATTLAKSGTDCRMTLMILARGSTAMHTCTSRSALWQSLSEVPLDPSKTFSFLLPPSHQPPQGEELSPRGY